MKIFVFGSSITTTVSADHVYISSDKWKLVFYLISQYTDQMSYIVLSAIAFLVGPLIYQVFQKNQNLIAILDGIVFITIAVFSLLYLTELSHSLPFLVLLALVAIGIFLPSLLERTFSKYHHQIHSSV